LTRASEHGFKHEAFIEKCGDKGALLVVIKSNDYIFGGYSSISFPAKDQTKI
jgi:hypothetical protein